MGTEKPDDKILAVYQFLLDRTRLVRTFSSRGFGTTLTEFPEDLRGDPLRNMYENGHIQVEGYVSNPIDFYRDNVTVWVTEKGDDLMQLYFDKKWVK